MRQFVPDGPEAILLPSDEEEMTEGTETDDGEDERESVVESRVSESTDSITTDDEDDWVPAPERTPRPLKSKSRMSFEMTSSSSLLSVVGEKGTVKRQTRVTRLTEGLTDLSITSEDAIDLLFPQKADQQKEHSSVVQPKKRCESALDYS
jgi:hypothetical protein